jgi:cell division protease FtsH
LAEVLFAKETLDEDDAYAAAGVARETAPAPPVLIPVPGPHPSR